MNSIPKINVLFVCMGNICRSPIAEGVFRHVVQEAGLANRFEIDSAGTHAYHVGSAADRRAIAAAERRGVSLDGIVSRAVSDEDFERFDYVIAMDEDNHQRLRDKCPPEHHSKIQLLLSYSDNDLTEVPDPYYGGAAGFERVLDLVEPATRDLLDSIPVR